MCQRRTKERRNVLPSAPPGTPGDPSGMTEALLTAGEVAELLGVSKEWVWQESRAGRIPTVSLGRYRRYRHEAIEDWIERMERPSSGRPTSRLASAREHDGPHAKARDHGTGRV